MIKYNVFGESHGKAVGIVIENLPSGIEINEDFILREMKRRQGIGKGITTSRKEDDIPEILSGVFEGKTTGTPLCAIIKNSNTISKDYSKLKTVPRPSHADFVALKRYSGYNDYRGGGHFSGRLTAPLVFAGAIAKTILKEKNIFVGSHILKIMDIEDEKFDYLKVNKELFDKIKENLIETINSDISQEMILKIQDAFKNKTSVGGIIETAIIGLPCGIGSPDDSIEGVISKNFFKIPAVKGIEFGLGFEFANKYGHEVNDQMEYENDEINYLSNNNGGIIGGISTSSPIIFRTVFKPTPSIACEQKSVDVVKKENVSLEITGRHDPCVAVRANVVTESVAALSVCQILGI